MTYDKNNIFNKIIQKTSKAKIEYEDESVIVIHDVNPVSNVHLLIIPKEKFENITQLIESEKEHLLFHCFQIAKKMAYKHNVKDGYKILTNNGSKAGQVIFHLHFHLIGFI